jgi:NAD(P)-dependent dehydrogenase (short-subunit alcohol dehydrogenase family)
LLAYFSHSNVYLKNQPIPMKKTVVILGGTGGIGEAAALALAKQGNDVIIQGRDTEKGKKIADAITQAGGTAQFINSAISSVEDVKNIASEIKKLTNKIDVLILSTGTLNSDRKETKDGLEEGFLVNYLSKFIVDSLLLNELKNGEGRIIIVGAPLMKSAAINFNDLQLKNDYSLMKGMGQNMLAVHMHAQEFAKKYGNKPSINVIHPGVVKSGIGRNLKGGMKFFVNVFTPLIGNSPEKAVVNILDVANTEKIESGYFYPKVAKPEAKQKIELDSTVAGKVWEESQKIAKL